MTPAMGSKVLANGRACEVIAHDPADSLLTYKVIFADASTDWFNHKDVWSEGTQRPTERIVGAVPSPAKIVGVGGPTTFAEFHKANPYFAVPWVLFMTALYVMRFVPMLQAYFERNGMQPYGFAPAAKLLVYAILCTYALHGWIAVNHDDLLKKGLKIVPTVLYKWNCVDATVRSANVLFFGMMAYAFVPMRMTPAATWGQSILEFLVGYLILLIGSDAWFFCVHYLAHTPSLYKLLHKRHHNWKHPVSFSAYFITSGAHLLQEHAFVVSALLLLPVPWTAFWFYQYYGVPASLLQHCGFELSALKVPFCGPLTLGHLESICGLGLGYVLGSQTTATHDYHHETFMGNFQLSYTYLDRAFGVHVPNESKRDAQEPLLSV